MMIYGMLQILLIIVFIVFYIVNFYDVKYVVQLINNGKKVFYMFKELGVSLVDGGFVYLLIILVYILMVFMIVFLVLVILLMVFMNYDFVYILLVMLLDWIGFKNFILMFFLSSYWVIFNVVFGWIVIWIVCVIML